MPCIPCKIIEDGLAYMVGKELCAMSAVLQASASDNFVPSPDLVRHFNTAKDRFEASIDRVIAAASGERYSKGGEALMDEETPPGGKL